MRLSLKGYALDIMYLLKSNLIIKIRDFSDRPKAKRSFINISSKDLKCFATSDAIKNIWLH